MQKIEKMIYILIPIILSSVYGVAAYFYCCDGQMDPIMRIKFAVSLGVMCLIFMGLTVMSFWEVQKINEGDKTDAD